MPFLDHVFFNFCFENKKSKILHTFVPSGEFSTFFFTVSLTDRDISISNIDKIFHIYWQTSTKLFVHQLPQYFIYTKPSKSLFWPFLLETIQSNHLQTDININTGCPTIEFPLCFRYFVDFFKSKLENLGEPKTKLELHCQLWDTSDTSECFAFVSFIN